MPIMLSKTCHNKVISEQSLQLIECYYDKSCSCIYTDESFLWLNDASGKLTKIKVIMKINYGIY